MTEVVVQPFPRYEVIEPFGEGGVATVYKVKAVDGAVRALKSLKPDQSDPATSIRRFEKEFQILSRLRHPSLPAVHDYGRTAAGSRFMVMDLVEGHPLDKYFETHKDELWMLIYEMVEALAFVHEHRLLHLDLKPDNILVKRTRAFGGELPLVMLIDFGLSLQRTGTAEKPTLVGTPGYIAPEVIREEDNPTRAADYYALGAILFELVEGRMSFEGNTHEVLQAHLMEPIHFKQQKVEYAELYPWIERLMSKEVNERLAAFEGFRRIVSARMSDDMDGLQKAYALGYIDSLGFIGKGDVWEKLKTWADAIDNESVMPSTRPRADDTDPLDHNQLLNELSLDAGGQAQGRAPIVALSGPQASGKTHTIEVVAARLATNGATVWRMRDIDVRAIPSSVNDDTQTLMVERFASVWEQINSDKRSALVIDGLADLLDEKSEFARFVLRRVASEIAGGTEPNVKLIVTDRSPGLVDRITEIGIEPRYVLPLTLGAASPKDVSAFLESFRGRIKSREERASFAAFLGHSLDSVGTLLASARWLVTNDSLRATGGQWQFLTPTVVQAPSESSGEYYRALVAELPEAAVLVLKWLSCHPDSIPISMLADLVGRSQAEVEQAITLLAPHRIVQRSHTGESRVGIPIPSIREALYENVDEPDRVTCHRAYVDLLQKADSPGATAREAIAFHLEQLGDTRSALLSLVKALSTHENARDIFAIRRVAEEAIRLVDEHGSRGALRLIRRWLVKRLVLAEWAMDNFIGLIRVMERFVVARGDEVPVSLAYYYAVALDRSARHADGLKAVNNALAHRTCRVPAVKAAFSLEKATLMNLAGDYESALEILDGIDASLLPTALNARLYVALSGASQQLGRAKEAKAYLLQCRELALRHGHYNHFVDARSGLAYRDFSAGRYEEALAALKESIRIAHRHRLYRQQQYAYFLASAVYYEQGRYERALRYLDRALKIATEYGMRERLGYGIRYAMIYQNLGLYGDAIRQINSVINQFLRDDSDESLLAALARFDLHVSVHSAEAVELLLDLEHRVAGSQSQHNLGYYDLMRGIFEYNDGRPADAIEWFDKAIDVYKRIEYEDDLIRSRVWIAYACESLGNTEKTDEHISSIAEALAKLEAPDLEGDYMALRLWVRVRREDANGLAEIAAASEQTLHRVSDVNVRMDLLRALFLSAIVQDDPGGVARWFNDYYRIAKKIVANLHGTQYAKDFVSHADFVDAVRLFKEYQKKNPGRDRV